MKKKWFFRSLIVITLLLCFYLCNRGCQAVRLALLAGADFFSAIDGIGRQLRAQPLFLSSTPLDVGVGVGAVLLVLALAGLKGGRKFRVGEEFGSARWGTRSNIRPYIDPVPDNNIILTKTVALSMGKPKKFEYSRNKNVLVLGGSGSGKT
ncbi:MAG: hypothetical protein RR185_08785, partial [Angelakisella sp.]